MYIVQQTTNLLTKGVFSGEGSYNLGIISQTKLNLFLPQSPLPSGLQKLWATIGPGEEIDTNIHTIEYFAIPFLLLFYDYEYLYSNFNNNFCSSQ